MTMIIPPSSDNTHYRVTFFFGPEPVDHDPNHLRCIFNVKKRSWKGGVHMSVEVAQNYVLRARERVGFDGWLNRLLVQVDQTEHVAMKLRAEDLFVQAFCSCALNCALHTGLEQEHQVITAEDFGDALDRVLEEQPNQLIDSLRLELDLEDPPKKCLTKIAPGGKSEGV